MCDTSIPNIVHFIFGLKPDFGKRNFSYIHYLAIISAHKQLNPEKIYFHYEYEPAGYWWERAKNFLKLNKIYGPKQIFGNPIAKYQHMADVLRLEILKEFGGIYLDIDIISLNSCKELLYKKNVMGIEPSVGLCNAIIFAQKNSEFISKWYETYRSYSQEKWNYFSIQMPMKIACTLHNDVNIIGYYPFYYPFYKDIAHFYLWGQKPGYQEKISSFIKNSIIKCITFVPYHRKKHIPILHQFKPYQWHYQKLNSSRFLHLWETMWWDKYLKHISPETIIDNTDKIFNRLIFERFSKNEINGKI